MSDLGAAGLPAPSKLRCKLFTLDQRLIRGRLGRSADADAAGAQHVLRTLLGVAA